MERRGRGRGCLVVGAGLLIVLAGGCGVFVAMQPGSFRIARSRTIPAAPARVQAALSDLRALAGWDPWPATPDAPRTITFSSVTDRPGASVVFRSRHGQTRGTLLAVTPNRMVLRFDTGRGTTRQVFDLQARGAGTEVTWGVEGDNDLLRRVLWPFVGLEARIGPDMEAGLARLEAAVTR